MQESSTEHTSTAEASSSLTCNNCGTQLAGRYCVACGQDANTHVPTLGELIGDGIASLLNLESRLWRTLGALFFRPGLLTQEYLAGRRARYVPPLRLYLVLSVFLFLIVSLDDNDNDDDEEVEDEVSELVADNVGAAAAAADPDLAAATGPGLEIDLDADDDEAGGDGGRRISFTDAAGNRIELRDASGCAEMDVPFSEPGETFDTAVREACVRNVEDGFASLGNTFADNLPVLAFLVIPVMAMVFKLFYVFTGRHYLAHLVFLCHTHAFTFLLFMIWNLLLILDWIVPAFGYVAIVWFLILMFYSPVYYFLALRRVYGQGRLLTLLKLPALMLIYFFVISFLFVVGFLAVMLTN
jgi:hypothetical protein